MKKKLVLLFIFTMFLGMGNVLAADYWENCSKRLSDNTGCAKAIYENQTVDENTPSFNENRGNLERVEIKHGRNGDTETAFCVDYNRQYMMPGQKYRADAAEYWKNYSITLGPSVSSITTISPAEFIKKLGIYKYYFEQEFQGTSNKVRNIYIQRAIWHLIRDTYCNGWSCYNNYSWNDSYEGPVNSHMNNAQTFYNKYKDEFRVTAYIWHSKGIYAGGDTSYGQPIITLDAERISKYDYSLDVACTNCDSIISDSKAYVIQDTTNWEAIMESNTIPEEVRCPQIPNNYFTIDNGTTFCRDEFYVYFPNQNNMINVSLGKIFSLNSFISAEFPVLRPVKVKRIRQCRSSKGKAELEKYTNTNLASFSTGDIYIKYNEKRYGKDDRIKLEKTIVTKENNNSNNEDYSRVSFIDNNQTLQFETIYSYTLPSNLYRFVRHLDGLSLNSCDGETFCHDFGQGTLPISLGNQIDLYENEISIQFAYELPEYSSSPSVSGTHIKDLMQGDGNYGKSNAACNNVENVYKKYKNGKDNENLIEKSSCMKLYGSISAASTCIDNHVNNSNTCDIGGFGENSYKCVLVDKCVNKSDADRIDLLWSEKENRCCPPGSKLDDGWCDICDSPENAEKRRLEWAENEPNEAGGIGKCCEHVDPNTGLCGGTNVCDTEEEAKADGVDWGWNENGGAGKCCAPDEKVDPSTGLCDKCDTEAEAKTLGVDWNSCPQPKGQYCCKTGETFNAETCTCQKDGGTPKGYIYRVVNLNNPFIGEEGTARNTGANWCYQAAEGTINCSGTKEQNEVVRVVFPEETVYSEDYMMYKVVLDPDSINKIRNYNKQNSYDDFNFTCANNGEQCTSNFLDNADYFKEAVTGNCAGVNAGSNNFYTCRKVGGS